MISKVRVFNRINNIYDAGERIKNMKISIGDIICGKLPDQTAPGEWYDVDCPKPIKGDTIKIYNA